MPDIGVVMGSSSDWDIMYPAVGMLNHFNVSQEYLVISAHRTPDRMYEYAKTARQRGLKAIIAGAGGAAHLPGMLASLTSIPILGVPISSKLFGVDSLLSIVQMPYGIPVAAFSIDNARNAALFAISMLANENTELANKLDEWRKQQAENAISFLKFPPSPFKP